MVEDSEVQYFLVNLVVQFFFYNLCYILEIVSKFTASNYVR